MAKCAELCANDFRHLVQVQVLTKTDDGAGGQAKGWANVGNIWCKIRKLSGRERLQARHLESQATHEFLTRWRGDITIDNVSRLLFRGREFNIRDVEDIEELNEFLRITAQEGVVN